MEGRDMIKDKPELPDLVRLREEAVSLISHGRFPLPEKYRSILFETPKEVEITYANKDRAADILADTMAIPLQSIKTFNNGKSRSENMLIFGDNLQVLKALLQIKEEGGLTNLDGTSGVKLVYIDPPFGSKQEFKGSRGQKAYQDKVAGAEFLEFLRKRLIFLKEIMHDEAKVFVHLDYRNSHYVKVIMDEIFDKTNFRNEIQVLRTRKNVQEYEEVRRLNTATDTILFYTKTDRGRIKPPQVDVKKGERWHGFDAPELRTGMDYPLFGKRPPSGNHWRWEKKRADAAVKNYKDYLKNHSDVTVLSYWKKTGKTLEFLRPKPNTGTPEYLVTSGQEIKTSLWDDISAYSFQHDFPTEKSQSLLERIIEMGSDKGDIVLDCFCGSGTTLEVAEKLGRKWIGVDCSKYATYVSQKRLLHLVNGRKETRPFTVFSAGLYDYQILKELPWEQYRAFALRLFQCRDQPHVIAGLQLDGYYGNDHVLVLNYQKYRDAVLDKGFIDSLHENLGQRAGLRFFIIAPAASARCVLQNYIDKGETKYYILRIPYLIVRELHKTAFRALRQPISEEDINDMVEATGFDFVQVPEVEAKYYLATRRTPSLDSLKEKECTIKIERFQSRATKNHESQNERELSMVMIDYDYNGKVFDVDYVVFAEDLERSGREIRFPQEKVGRELMVIYVDTHGNEKSEVKTLADFGV